SGAVWDKTKSVFESDFSCYTLTMAGFAGVPAQGDPAFNYWKTSIARYIKDNVIEKAIIVGHSMGGVLAMALASDYPELSDRIVVVDGLPCLQALYNPSFKALENPNCSTIIDQMTSMSEDQFYQMQ